MPATAKQADVKRGVIVQKRGKSGRYKVVKVCPLQRIVGGYVFFIGLITVGALRWKKRPNKFGG